MAATAAMLVGNSVRPSCADVLRKCDDAPLFTLRLKSSSGNFAARNNQTAVFSTITAAKTKKKVVVEPEPEVEEEEVVEEVEVLGDDEEEEGESWVSERVHDVQEATQAMIEAVPGPRVGSSGMPWLVALPLAYMVLTFIVAVVRTVRKRNTPQAKRRRQVSTGSKASIRSSSNSSAAGRAVRQQPLVPARAEACPSISHLALPRSASEPAAGPGAIGWSQHGSPPPRHGKPVRLDAVHPRRRVQHALLAVQHRPARPAVTLPSPP